MAVPERVLGHGLGQSEGVEDKTTAYEKARLRALDAMLGGIAHDLNNALSVVLMNLDVMQQDPVLGAKHGRRIDGMLDAMTGASALVRHLLNFSHSRRPEPEVVSIAEALPRLIELIQVAVGKEIAVGAEPGETGPCCVVVDQAEFEVAVVDAALQLVAAMSNGGTLTFSLRGGTPSSEDVTVMLRAEPRNPLSVTAGVETLDLTLLDLFARDAQGSTVSTASDSNGWCIGIYLPGCPATTV